jgi:AcrR family transcriptional regulator
MTERSVIMSRARTETPEIRRKQILDAARSIMVQQGYQGVKMDEVAKRCKLAKGTLYLHFKDKSQIVAAVFDDLMDQLEKKFQELSQYSGLELLQHVAEVNLEFLRKNQDFFSQFIHARWTLTGSNKASVQKRFHQHMEMIKGFIDTAVKSGEIPKHDPFIGSFYFMSLIRMFWVKDQFFTIERDTSNDVNVLMDLFMNGIQAKLKKGKIA